jgi:polysaccharide biosynthesis/export protein
MKRIPCILIVLFCLSACVPQKKITYFQQPDPLNQTVVKVQEPAEHQTQPGDILYVRVQSIDPKASAFLNGPETQTTNGNALYTEQSLYFTGYEVGQNGMISLPLLDSLHVQGFTIDQVAQLITDSLHGYIDGPVVTVKLSNFRVAVFGEVQNPGSFTFFSSRVTIFQALAQSRPGDFANLKSAVITRQTAPGEVTIQRVDLTGSDIVASQYYYLQPNDQIYLEPLPVKRFGFKDFPYALLLGVVNTAIIIFSVFKN